VTEHIEPGKTQERADSLESPAGPVAESDTTPEVSTPMLDVHAPHDGIHTWRSFFVHVATICVGLLIAIGLEQSVEFFHHRHQLNESRERLRSEHEDNRRLMAYQLREFRRYNKVLQGNLADFIYLQQHPGTSIEKLPEALSWSAIQIVAYTSAWSSAKLSNITALMPPDELHRFERVYESLDTAQSRYLAFRTSLGEARAYTTRDIDPAHLTPQQLEKQIELTEACLFQHYAYGVALWAVSNNVPDMPAPGLEELNAIVHESTDTGHPITPEAMEIVRFMEQEASRFRHD
jgi:hypothetical protein